MQTNIRYRVAKAPTHPKAQKDGYVYEHVLVAEKKLGRHLKKGEVVHHIDKNRRNNNPNNIIVFATNADHTMYHNGAKIYEKNGIWYAIKMDKFNTCLFCGKKYKVKTKTEMKHRSYCSTACAHNASRKFNLSIDELIECIYEHKGNFSEVARLFNISANAIVRRLKTNNKPYHSKDYRK